MTRRSNETKEKKFDTYNKKSPKAPIGEYTNIHNNVNKKRVTVIGDSMVKFVMFENLSDENYIANIRTNAGCTTKDIADYIKLIIRRKSDIILVHTGTNNLTNSVNTMNKVRKVVKAVEEMDGNNKIKLGFSSIILRKDRDLDKEIKETNTKLKNYCIGKGFTFVNNANINEKCLNNNKLHLNKKGTTLFTKNIYKSFSSRFE